MFECSDINSGEECSSVCIGDVSGVNKREGTAKRGCSMGGVGGKVGRNRLCVFSVC